VQRRPLDWRPCRLSRPPRKVPVGAGGRASARARK
jgi:hypothetical protein